MGQRAVGVEDRIVAVLPALVDQPGVALAAVLDEAVAVAIARLVHPAQRRQDVRPQPAHGLDVVGAFEIGARQHDEQRRGIDAAVVVAERHLAQQRHLALAHLVQDLAGLGVGRLVGGLGLVARQVAQHAAGDGGIEPQRLHGGDQRVAAEHRAEPRNAGIGIGTVRRVGDQHVEVGDRPAYGLVERRAGAGDRRGACRRGAQRPPRPPQRLQEARPCLVLRVLLGGAIDRQVDVARLAGLQDELEEGAIDAELVGRRRKAHHRASGQAVEAGIAQRDGVAAHDAGMAQAVALAARAADLEQVGEVGGERQAEPQALRLPAEVAHRQPLVAGRLP